MNHLSLSVSQSLSNGNFWMFLSNYADVLLCLKVLGRFLPICQCNFFAHFIIFWIIVLKLLDNGYLHRCSKNGSIFKYSTIYAGIALTWQDFLLDLIWNINCSTHNVNVVWLTLFWGQTKVLLKTKIYAFI